MRTDLLMTCFLAASLFACNGDKSGTDTGTTDTDTDDTDTTPGDTDTDTTPAGDTYDIQGMGIDVATQAPAAEGLCVRLLDPTSAIGVPGGVPTELGSTTLGAGGTYSFSGVTEKPAFGLLVEIADCGTPNTTVYTSATGIAQSSYADLEAGAVLSGVQSFSIDMALLTGMDASAEATTLYSGDLAADGFLFAFVLDATGTPVDGATVGCPGCGPTFYMDADPTDGLFTTGATLNPGTVAIAGAAFMIPSAQITSYSTTATGLTFGDVLIGSAPGSATIAAFFANP